MYTELLMGALVAIASPQEPERQVETGHIAIQIPAIEKYVDASLNCEYPDDALLKLGLSYPKRLVRTLAQGPSAT